MDLQSAFCALACLFPKEVLDLGGAGEYIPKADSKIRRIKELNWSVKAGLKWELPPTMIMDLVEYAASVGPSMTVRSSKSWLLEIIWRLMAGSRILLSVGAYLELLSTHVAI
jgi:hypothetical protein